MLHGVSSASLKCFLCVTISDRYWISVCECKPELIPIQKLPQIVKFMGPTWGPPGSCRPQMDPMLAPWTLLSGTTLRNAIPPIADYYRETAMQKTLSRDSIIIILANWGLNKKMADILQKTFLNAFSFTNFDSNLTQECPKGPFDNKPALTQLDCGLALNRHQAITCTNVNEDIFLNMTLPDVHYITLAS